MADTSFEKVGRSEQTEANKGKRHARRKTLHFCRMRSEKV